MFEEGIYRLFHVMHNSGKPEQRLIGRFMINKGQFNVLEDHDNILTLLLPDGAMDSNHEKTLFHLIHSTYFKVVKEDEINEGYHDDLIPQLDIGPVESDAEYMLSGPTLESPQRLEMFGENVILDNKKLSEEEIKSIMDRVHRGELKLIPL